MKNKKGFTLIELLAVIVILAIIMVIAVPQILNVINNSREKAWDENVSMIKSAIQNNALLSGTGMAEGQFTTLEAACSSNVSTIISSIVKYDDTIIDCTKDTANNEYIFGLTGSGQFNGKSGLIICSATGNCRTQGDTHTYVGPGGATTFNSSWKVWTRQDITTSAKQLCAKFSNGTVCFGRGDYDIRNWDIVSNERYTALIQKFTNAGATCNAGVAMTCSEGTLTCQANDHGYNAIVCSISGGDYCMIGTDNSVSCSQ